jgi:uncharacterized protein YdaU (DUF1376 family)
LNYYPHHLGDYAKDTGHLSLAEHGSYRLLLDHYYSTENPLPGDLEKLCRICRATTKSERAAVAFVVEHFFTLVEGVYRNERCETEIAKSYAIREKNAKNGLKGGRPKQTPEKPTGFSVGSVSHNPDKRLPNNQEPRTNPPNPPGGGIAHACEPARVAGGTPPPTPEQCAAQSRVLGVLSEVATAYWHDRNAVGWVSAKGIPIRNWHSDLKAFASRWASVQAERTARSGPRPTPAAPQPQNRPIHDGKGI